MLDLIYITNYINYGYTGNVPAPVKRARYRNLATILVHRMQDMTSAQLIPAIDQYNALLKYSQEAI